MSITEAKKIAKKYAKTLLKKNFPYKKIYLYGSCASGKSKKYSDIDIAVVVKNFKKDSQYVVDKMKLWEYVIDVDHRIEPLLLEESDIGKEESIMGAEINKYGILIK